MSALTERIAAEHRWTLGEFLATNGTTYEWPSCACGLRLDDDESPSHELHVATVTEVAVRAQIADAGLVVAEPCICDTGPMADGPAEACPQHGRSYSDWVEWGDMLQARLNAATENMRTEWGVQHAQGFVSNEYGRPYTEAQARQKATDIEAGDRRRRREARGKTRLMTRKVTDWEVAP